LLPVSIAILIAEFIQQITNRLLHFISPLYALLNLCGALIFVILFSSSGIPVSHRTEYTIAADFIDQFLYFATAAALLFMDLDRTSWNVQPSAGTISELLVITERGASLGFANLITVFDSWSR
jgi:hypothetical protein